MRQVRSLAPESGGRIPGIAITGYVTPEDRERVLSAGFQVHVAKPVDPGALARAVHRVLAASNA